MEDDDYRNRPRQNLQQLLDVETGRAVDSGLEDSASDYDENQNAEPEMQIEDIGEQPEIKKLIHRYDTGLPSLHSYLGPELEVVRGRTVLEEKETVMLHLMRPLEVVLMPGQTLPLSIFDAATVNMMHACLKDDRTFGVLAHWNNGRRVVINSVGTTAEIFEYLPEEGNAGFRIKAKARQRFRVVDSKLSFKSKVKVQILPEVNLPDPLQNVKLECLNRNRTSTVNRHRFRRMDAAVTHWPAFVYEQYNVNRLVQDVKHELTTSLRQVPVEKTKDNPKAESIVPEDPTDLSFWVAQNVPMVEKHRVRILSLDSPIQRLRLELKAIQQSQQFLRCTKCGNEVGYRSDIFAMSAEGPLSTYVNPGGFLHETMTLSKVKHIVTEGRPTTEFSWFPGYAWTICKCKYCNLHLGWKFLATKSHLRPAKFWGLSRRSITVNVGMPDKSEENYYSFLVH